MVCVSASVNLPLHHKVQSSLLAPAHPGGPGKRTVKWLWCGGGASDLFHDNTQQQHLFNDPLSRTTQVRWYQKGKTNLDFAQATDSEWQWHQLDHMQICTSPQTDNHASTARLSFLTGRMTFLPPNQQRQSTEGNCFTNVLR